MKRPSAELTSLMSYDLFRSKAKITSYRSFKWHLLVIWYLNPKLTYDEITELARYISDKDNGFTTIQLTDQSVVYMVDEVFEKDLEEPPKNKMRKIIFKEFSGLETSEKLSIVGKLIGRKKLAEPPDIYEAMLYIHDDHKKITISKIANATCVDLQCTTTLGGLVQFTCL